MPRTAWLALGLGVAIASSGCTLSFVKEIEGTPEAARASRELQLGSSLGQVLATLGPPDVTLALWGEGETRTRLYYVHHVLSEVRLSLFGFIPLGATSIRPTAFIHRFGGETLELARLDFDASGRLVDPQYARIELSRRDYSVAVDNRLARTFYEDRDRALFVRERRNDEDDEDDEDDEPAK